MGTTYVYRYVTDNEIIITPDGTRVQVIKRNNRFYPCAQCKFQHSQKFPATDVHMVQQRSIAYQRNIYAGCGGEYADFVGDCDNYEQRK